MALALTVREGEAVSIGHDIVVAAQKTSGRHQVRVFIVAPKNVRIVRLGEVDLSSERDIARAKVERSIAGLSAKEG